MSAHSETQSPSTSQTGATKNITTAEKKGDFELVIARTFNAPPRIVFEAWTKPELMKRWWAPKSSGMTLVTCEVDARTGGKYRLGFGKGDAKVMEFFGKYIEVTPSSRLVWTNDEAGDAGSVTTALFEDKGDKTHLVVTERYPTKEALDEAFASGMCEGSREQHVQLDELLATLAA